MIRIACCQIDPTIADLAANSALIETTITKAVAAGADVAVGSRYVPGGSVPNWTLSRRLLSRWGNGYAKFMLRLRLQDATTAFRVYRASTLEGIDIDAEHDFTLAESLWRRMSSRGA